MKQYTCGQMNKNEAKSIHSTGYICSLTGATQLRFHSQQLLGNKVSLYMHSNSINSLHVQLKSKLLSNKANNKTNQSNTIIASNQNPSTRKKENKNNKNSKIKHNDVIIFDQHWHKYFGDKKGALTISRHHRRVRIHYNQGYHRLIILPSESPITDSYISERANIMFLSHKKN